MSAAALDEICARAGEGNWRYVPRNATGTELPEAQRLYTLAAEEIEQANNVVLFQRVSVLELVKPKTTGRPGDVEISRFLRLLDLVHTVPWASAQFDHNHKIILQLTASHLELLLDPKIARAHGPRLRALIGEHVSVPCLDPSCRHRADPLPHRPQTKDANLVWITNRQQGKTTSLAKFLACLSLAAPRGGNLVGIYSTSLDRGRRPQYTTLHARKRHLSDTALTAQEVMRAAKSMIFWLLKGDKLSKIGYSGCRMSRDNEHAYVVHTGTVENRVAARPKNVASCRGDAFSAVMACNPRPMPQSYSAAHPVPL